MNGPPQFYGPPGSWQHGFPPQNGPPYRGNFGRPPGVMNRGCYRAMGPRFPPEVNAGYSGGGPGQWPPPFSYPPGGYDGYRPPNDMKFQPRALRPQFNGRGLGARGCGPGGGFRPKLVKKNQQNSDKQEFAYFCETCDRGFKQEDKYKEHCNEHVKCSIDGCSYTAAAKLVKLHHEWQHKTGFAKKIWKLDSAEEIEKWREERRKNYPTKENIERKKKLEQVKIERGEVVETKDFGKIRVRGRGRGRGQKIKDHQSETSVTTTIEAVKSLLPEVDPLSYLLEKNKDDDIEKVDVTSGAITAIGGALSSLITSYGSSDSDEPVEEIRIDKCPETIEQMSTNDSTNQKKKKFNHRVQRKRRNPTRSQKRKRQNQNDSNQDPAWKKIRKPSLLEKLLANEIRHERNVMLQCVHFIVKNNFFGVAAEKSTDEVKTEPKTENIVDEPKSMEELEEIWESAPSVNSTETTVEYA